MAGELDVTIDDQGTVWLFCLHTQGAREWAEEHIDTHLHHLHAGRASSVFAADWRCGQAIAEGMIAEGFLVSTD